MANAPGQNIDWPNLEPSVAQYLRSQGYMPGSGEPLSKRDQKDLAVLGVLDGQQPKRKPLCGYDRIGDCKAEKSKRKQQGRGENQLELAFGERLNIAKLHYEIREWWLKPSIFRIGPSMTFEPDFMVLDNELATWLIDTKGPKSWEDSRIKIKIAAGKFYHTRWLIVTRPEGAWKAKEVTAEKGIGRKFIELPWLN